MSTRNASIRWTSSILTLLLVVAIYWPGLGGGFIFDDIQNLVLNPTLAPDRWGWSEWIAAAFSSPASTVQRPLAMLSFALNAYFSGMDAWAMKLTNMGIHMLNTLLAVGLVSQLVNASRPQNATTDDSHVAQAIGVLWAVNPINLMAVLYVVQRMESLSHTFVLAGLWLYALGRSRQLAGQAAWSTVVLGIAGGTALGLSAKESAALLPVYALALEISLFHFKGVRQKTDKWLLSGFVLLLFVPGLYLLYRYLPGWLGHSNMPGRDFTLAQRLLTEPRVVMEYLHWMVLPNLNELSLYHDDFKHSTGILSPPATLVGLLGIPALLAAAFLARKRRPLTTLGILWFLSAHLLTGTFIPLELVFEHRNYFSSLGACIVLGDLLLLAPASRAWRKAGVACAAGLVLFYAGITMLRSIEWSSPLRFAMSEAEKHPSSPRATYDLARNFVTLTQYKSDSPFVQPAVAALHRARAAPNAGILATHAAIVFASRSGQPIDPSLWTELQSRLRNRPIAAQDILSLVALSDCAVEGLCSFPPGQMLATFDAALSHGANPAILSVYGKYAVHVLRDADLALRLWTEARSIDPNNPQFRANLAMLQIQLGMTEEAATEIQALRKLGRFGQHQEAANQLEKYSRVITRQRAEARQSTHD